MPIHVVAPGECLSRIAQQYGFTEYRTIWEHPRNAPLRQIRPSPFILHPRDVVFIPEKQQRQEPRGTGSRYDFVIPIPTRTLRLCLEDAEGQPLANEPYTLTVGKQIYRGTTDGQGGLRQEVPMDAQEAEISVPEHTWPLQIGHLNPAERALDNGVSGIKARLRNLGYDPGPIEGAMDEKAQAAIREFQRDEILPEDGECRPGGKTLARLLARHGC